MSVSPMRWTVRPASKPAPQPTKPVRISGKSVGKWPWVPPSVGRTASPEASEPKVVPSAPARAKGDARAGAYPVEFVAFDDAEQPADGLRQVGEDGADYLQRLFVRRVSQVQEGGAAARVERGAPLAAVGLRAVEAGFGQPDVGHHLGVEVDEAVVAGDDEGGAVQDAGAFRGVADRADRTVGGADGAPDAIRLPAVRVLGGVGRDQVQRHQSGSVGFQDVGGHHSGRVVTRDVGGGVVPQVEAAGCLPLQFLPKTRRTALAHRQQAVDAGVEGVDLRHEPVDRRADRHRPGDRRGPPAGLAHGVPERGDPDRRFVPVPLAALAFGFEGAGCSRPRAVRVKRR